LKAFDADDGARHRSSDFPPEKFLAEIVNIRERNTHNRVAGLFQARQPQRPEPYWALLRVASKQNTRSLPLDRRLREAFPIHGNYPFADFPVDSAISCSSHAPRSEIPAKQ